MRVEPFTIAVDDRVLEDLQVRLTRTRWPGAAPGEPWTQGTDLGWLQDLCAYWAAGYDWRIHERALNAHPQFVADLDGLWVHYVHVRRGGTPLILTHGWPSAFVEYLPLVDRLAGFDLVIPSLPGYGFSERPPTCTTRDVARLWHRLMRGLGYTRYAAGGTDFGSEVTTYMALDDPDPLVGIHLSNVDNQPTPTTPLTDAEQAFVAATERWDAVERGYSLVQGTRPQTLAVGLTDSPAGLAAWILEKWRQWADTGGDIDARFDRDFLLTLVTLYWVTGTIGTSIRDYADNRAAATAILPPGSYVRVPTAIANFHHNYADEGTRPREWAERLYHVTRFTDMPRGGHFAAVEEPDLLAADITAALAQRHR
jgi:pimeloyl-ACP methyl ester carboxylesterase